jgi:hypothetical protein
MGKGGDNCQGIGIGAALADSAEDLALLGDAKRIGFTYQLTHQLTGLGVRDLLTEPRGGTLVTDAKNQNKVMVHNALMQIIPEAFSDRDKYQRALDMYYALLLDGDIRANHLWHYIDERTRGWWTPGAGRAAMNWYGLPLDREGLQVDGLASAIRKGLDQPVFFQHLVRSPVATLASCVDPLGEYDPRQPLAEQAAVDELWHEVDAGDLPKSAENVVRMHYAREATSSMEHAERHALIEALSSLPAWGMQPNNQDSLSSAARQLVEGLQVSQSEDGLPQVKAKASSAQLADLWQAWMASPWCDRISHDLQIASGAQDDLEWLERTRQVCWRTSWKSSWGRKHLQKGARAQESRLRKIAQDLLQPGKRPSKAPAKPTAL